MKLQPSKIRTFDEIRAVLNLLRVHAHNPQTRAALERRLSDLVHTKMDARPVKRTA